MKPHEERVVTEHAELHIRLTKLREFIVGDKFSALEPSERSRLRRQETHMAAYLDVLDERIANF